MLMSFSPPASSPPRHLRAHGGVRLRVASTLRGSAPLEIAESGGYRVRFPRGRDCEGVFINTGGGMAGGDTMALDVALDPGAAAVLTTQAAEKLYRAEGEATRIDIRLSLAAGSRLDWLPQEQIFFDGARLARRLDVTMEASSRLLLVESIVFGRGAMGESVIAGSFRDSWRLRRAGRLVFAEEIRLEGGIAARLGRKAVADGARAMATCLLLSPDAEALRDEARGFLGDAASACAVSAFDGMLVARMLGRDPQALRADLVRFLERLRGRSAPRNWSI